ncbi:MAG: (2Fe-2S)-binding protein [Anaerolineales bacterium]|nr:(2Fe-2S)-binding protein [Anaerolineales bacterium]
MDHPIEQTLAFLAAANEDYRSQLLAARDEQPGWLSASQLQESAHLAPLLQANGAHHKASDQQSPAALWFGHYIFNIMAVAVTCYLAAGRVPDLRPASVALRFDEDGEPQAIAWEGRRFVALAGDPAADHPDCTPLPDADALRLHLTQQLEAHCEAIILSLRQNSRIGVSGLWLLARDYYGSAFSWIGELLGNQPHALQEARAAAALPTQLARQRDFVCVEHAGYTYQLLDRVSCCLYYKTDEGRYCSNCPHRPMPERIDLIKGWLTERAAAEAAAAAGQATEASTS